ncbi:transcriptional regulator [Nisaea sp.]|uniref:P-II family nitrogen regulator n=1 Tax=Nisaea sp. TaxID=2024842 RepID=UPI0032EBB6F0
MQTHSKVRLDILIEQLAVPRLAAMLDSLRGVNGYTILPVQGGSGLNGIWTRDGQVAGAEGMMMLWCILDRHHKDTVLEAVFGFVNERAGLITVSDVKVVRADKF